VQKEITDCVMHYIKQFITDQNTTQAHKPSQITDQDECRQRRCYQQGRVMDGFEERATGFEERQLDGFEGKAMEKIRADFRAIEFRGGSVT
jgi:hypothetical protein